jgi:exopolysaccharide biosynthesis protein
VKSIPKYSGPPPVLNPISGYSDSNSWYSLTNKARTVIGLTQDNKTLVLFTVDAAGGSIGMAVGEVADLLISDYDVYNALNLDGGGSTTLAMEDPPTHVGQIMNVPADNPLGRAVGSNLAVFAADRLAEE